MKSNNITQTYNSAVSEIKLAILNSQSKAIASVNAEQLALYLSIGRYISENTRKGFWGTGALKYISEHLMAEMPGLRGFSERNLKYMRTFYEEWHPQVPNLIPQQIIGQTSEVQSIVNSALTSAELTDSDFMHSFKHTPFTHHKIILTQCKDLDKRKYYVTLTAKEHLSVDALKKAIAADEYNHRGTLPNNFHQKLSPEVVASRSVMAFKDEYLLDFINVEELGVRDIEEVDERVVEQQIVQNIKNFILTLYVGFTGTPVDSTIEVFGGVIDRYTMVDSVNDGITVRIVYEGRAAKVVADNAKLQEIEQYYEECEKAGSTEEQINKSKQQSASLDAIIGDPQRLDAVAAD